MTQAEIVLTRKLARTKMSEARIMWIVGSLPTDKEVNEMLRFIEANPESSPAEFYSTALKILRETNPNLLEETEE